PSHAAVLTGLDILEKQNFAPLAGKRVGLIANHTSIDREDRSAVDVLFNSGKVKLAAIFSPEHGFRGTADHGEKVESSTDTDTGLTVYSLYGKTRRPSPEMLAGLDALVFDIQDVGARFYTYLATMGYAMEEADNLGLDFFVLDRPNPITGSITEGPVLADGIRFFTAYFPVPVRHGLTPGEMARLHAADKKLSRIRLTVIPLEGWERSMWYDETGLRRVNPSPNIRSVEAEALYPGIGCFEATNVAVGRGTDSPFTWFGAPWLKGRKLAKKLSESGIAGIKFERKKLTPSNDVYSGEKCDGVKMTITDRNVLRSLEIFIRAACILREIQPDEFRIKWEEMRKMTGTDSFRALYTSGAAPEVILAEFDKSRKEFEESRKQYLLYR
ncbi:MAG: DUF1343 domain-containing protein, partial [bacterium]